MRFSAKKPPRDKTRNAQNKKIPKIKKFFRVIRPKMRFYKIALRILVTKCAISPVDVGDRNNDDACLDTVPLSLPAVPVRVSVGGQTNPIQTHSKALPTRMALWHRRFCLTNPNG
jgi:hypothetical protein